jgi:uncharacterized membrane protein
MNNKPNWIRGGIIGAIVAAIVFIVVFAVSIVNDFFSTVLPTGDDGDLGGWGLIYLLVIGFNFMVALCFGFLVGAMLGVVAARIRGWKNKRREKRAGDNVC